MIKYQAQLNLGNAALGSEKSISANEICETVDAKYISEEINHLNPLVPVTVAEEVVGLFCEAVARLMGMGFAVQLKNGNDVTLRIHPDIHVKGGNINLARAQQLDPTVTELTKENAGALIDKAGGVTLRVAADVQAKFTELLKDQKPSIERKTVVEMPYVGEGGGNNQNSSAGSGQDENGGGGNTGGNTGGNGGGGDNPNEEGGE